MLSRLLSLRFAAFPKLSQDFCLGVEYGGVQYCIIGYDFAAHGYAKLSRGPENFAAVLKAIGVPLPHLMAWVTSLVEFMGGISLMAGAFVLPLTLPMAVVMMTAMFSVHFQYGYSSIRLKAVTAWGAEFGSIGYEMNLLYIAGLLTLALSSPIRLSLDH